jgi:ubiquinone/menaquinone biosynthesis C-methylase UbiE
LLLGIPDFRDAARDSTANYPIDSDLHLARLLADVYPRLATYNEIHLLYEELIRHRTAGEPLSAAMVEEILASGRYPPQALSDDQLVHGHAILARVDQYLEDAGEAMPPRGVALENGAGRGLHIDGFAASFERLVVVDFSMVYLILGKKMADERGHANVLLICASAERLPLRDETIDFIHSNDVVEHITDKPAMFREAKRVLRTGGLLFVRSRNRFLQRSSRNLRSLALAEFDVVRMSSIPRRSGSSLKAPLIGDAADLLVNKLLLPIMPWHAALCFKRPARPAPVGQVRKAATPPAGLAPVR